MNNVKILLAGPGTGKTTRVKDIIQGNGDDKKILVLSFTNATINDLLKNFQQDNINITPDYCMTLHKYASKVNHNLGCHILDNEEVKRLESYSKKLNIALGVCLSNTLGPATEV